MHGLDVFVLVSICLYATGHWIAASITLILAIGGWYNAS